MARDDAAPAPAAAPDAPAAELGPVEPATTRRADVVGVALVTTLAIVAMLPTLRGGFLPGDDAFFILNHSYVNRPGLLNALRLFGIIHRDLYQPLPMLSFAIDTAIYGTNAWGFHLTNVLWHGLAVALVWLLIRARWRRWWLAGLTASVFAVHPLAVDTVAVASNRIVEMGVTFSLGAILALFAWSRHEEGENGWLATAILLTALGMMSKVQIALPVILLIVVYGQQRRSPRAWWCAWAAMTAITVAFVALAAYSTLRVGMLSAAMAELPGSIVSRALMAMGIYLRNLVWPTRLSTWYLPPPVWSWNQPLIWLGATGLIGLIALAIVCWRRQLHDVAAGLGWYLFAIAPMLYASGARNLIAADRYTYMADVGIFLALAALLVHLADRMRRGAAGIADAVPVGIVSAGLVGALLIMSWKDAANYETGLAYYRRAAEISPNATWARLNVGWELAKLDRLDEAEREARAELNAPHGDRPRADQLLGWIAEKRGDLDRAVKLYEKSAAALGKDPVAYYRLARVLQRQHHDDRARAAYEQALKIHPENLPSLMGLAELEEQTGRFTHATALLKRALRVNPQHVGAITQLATLDLRVGDLMDAERLFREALAIDPDRIQARTNLAVILADSNRENEALSQYNRVLAEAPELLSARLNRADLLQRWGHNAEAAEDYKIILSSDPGNLPALEGMQAILLKIDPQTGPSRAVSMWSTAMKHAGQTPALLDHLAWAQALAGMDADAETTAARSLRQQPAQPLAYLANMIAALHRGQVDPAVDALKKACESPGADAELVKAAQAVGAYGIAHPKDPLAYLLLGRILLAQRQLPLATKTFQELIKVADDPVWAERIKQALSIPTSQASRPTTRSQPATSRVSP